MLQQVETKERELQLCYDKVWWIVKTIAITQRLAKLREAQVLKAQVDAT